MSNRSVFQLGGWSALLSVIASLGMFALVGGGRGVAFTSVSIIAAILTALPLIALYVIHRPQSPALSLLMLVAAIVGLTLENLGSGPETALGVVSNVVYGVAFVLLGYLGVTNAQMPRGLALLASGVGVLALVSAVANGVGLGSVAAAVGMLMVLVWAVWSVWLWRWLISPKLVTAIA